MARGWTLPRVGVVAATDGPRWSRVRNRLGAELTLLAHHSPRHTCRTSRRGNGRANNLKLYQDVKDTFLDLYVAVRNRYLQRRQKSIEDAIRQRESESFFVQDGEFEQ